MKAFIRNYAAILVAIVVAAGFLAVALAYPGESHGGAAIEPVTVRAKLADYSWDELSRISAEIGRCANRDDAVACAARYGLCATDGSLSGFGTKDVQLADGRTVPVALVDVYRDELTSGGKAGLAFMFLQPVGEHAMNHAFENRDGNDPDSVGGWASCDMRAWLNGDFLYELPADLRACLARVQKPTAGAVGASDELDEPGHLGGTGTDWVRETSDLLWLLSASELCGNVPAKSDLGVDSTMTSVYASEGEQYRLFADWDVTAFQSNAQLAFDNGECGEVADGESTLVGAAKVSSGSAVTIGDCGSVKADERGAGSAKQVDFHTQGTSTNSPCTWWLRTKTLEFGDGFWLVGTDGAPLNGLGEDARVANDPSFAPDDLWGPDHARGVIACFCL